jgi:hypothetical protein
LSSPTDELQLPPVTEPEQRREKQRSRVSAAVAAPPKPGPKPASKPAWEPDTLGSDSERTNVAPPTHAQQVAQQHARSEMQSAVSAPKPHRPPTKKLTMMTVAPDALISSSESELPVFTETRDKYEQRSSPRPVSGAMPKPKQPTRAPVAAPPPADDDLVPTLMEARPSPEELGLEPAPVDLLASDEQVEGARTEPTRMPAFMADRPSTTAPGRDKHQGGLPIADDDERYDPNGPTTEIAHPSMSAFGRVKVAAPDARPPPASPAPSRRVSTGSRRVISLTDEDEKKRRR